MDQKEAENILGKIEKGYDLISDKFSQTRRHFWNDLEFIKNYAENGDKVLDFGCGNGRLRELLSEKNIKYWGVDISEKLIELAKNRYSGENTQFFKIDPSQTMLPFKDNFFNAVFSIAVFHHFPGSKYRKAMAKELYRITNPGGHIIITVWNLWQRKYFKEILKNWKDKLLGKSSFDWNDCQITFTDNKGDVFNRYHHAFFKRELVKIFSEVGFEKEMIIGKKNIVYIGKK